MTPYMLGDASKLISPEALPIYDLYAIVNHYGILQIDIGHYTAMVKPPSNEGLEKNGVCVCVCVCVCVRACVRACVRVCGMILFSLFPSDWLCYDDDAVYRLPEKKVQTKDAYILFYIRRDRVKSPNRTQ